MNREIQKLLKRKFVYNNREAQVQADERIRLGSKDDVHLNQT
jgi:hypothetical protein